MTENPMAAKTPRLKISEIISRSLLCSRKLRATPQASPA
jgi:hypothetical protein